VTRVLAVDPGLTRCGVGVVDGGPGQPLRMQHVAVLTTSPQAQVAIRLRTLAAGIEALLSGFRPDVVVVERVFSQQNVASAMATAQAAAVALLLAARAGLPTAEHTPTQVKAAVTGNGQADKSQVAAMVVRLLGLPKPPTPVDATDALALAICHLWRIPMLQRIRSAEVPQ
jgi:crossover junction endodeoxyribonuclease RuvC